MKILVADILQSKAQTLINTVNCVGIMGNGIALEFKERLPLDAPTIASTIRNLGLLHWLDVTPDANLPVADEEFVSA